MSTITVDEIERNLPGFLRRMEVGEMLLVVRGDRAVAEIKPLPPATTAQRPFGLAAGQFVTPDDFDVPLPNEVLKEFEGA